MKKILALLALVLGVVSCQTEPEGLDVNVGGEVETTVCVSLPETTRANSALGAFDNVDLTGAATIRYILQIFDQNDRPSDAEYVKYSDEKSVVFPVRLVPGRHYRFVVWADYVDSKDAGDKHYNTRNAEGKIDLTNITLKDTWVAMDETRDAFTGYFDTEDEGKQYTSTSSINITLKRPFAKLRVITTDMKELGNLGIEPHNAVATYTTKFHQSFNAYNGEYGDETVEKTHTFNYEDVTSYTDQTGANKVLFTDYFFADDSDVVKFILDVKEDDGTSIKENNFSTDIHVQRNYLTTIQGNILTDGNNVEVKVEDAFSEPENVINVFNGVYNETITLTTGIYYFENVSVTTTSGPAIQIAEGSKVTINVKGNLKLNGATDGIAVGSSTLTINGVAETRSNEKFGNLNVVANGGYGIGGIGATVTIKNTTIDYICGWPVQPLFENDEKYGKSEPEGYSAIGGANINLENVEIVKAEGGSKAAAIGNRYWQSTNIVILNSTLRDIFGGNASAAIGGSRYSDSISADNKQVVEVKIENSTITNAVGGQYGAAIGSGYDTHCAANETNSVNKITIVNSTITAQGGKYAAGIGTGFHAAALTGSIDAASTINATAGVGFYKDSYTHAQNIGYGIVDPAREYKDTVVTFTVAGNVIAAPMCAYAEGVAKRDENTFCIYNAAGLKWVSDVVNATTPYTATLFDNATVELMNDIDLNNEEWIPIGDDRSQRTEWHGVFDGKGFTVKNVKITKKTDREDENKSSYGLFGNVKGTVKNLTVENVSISGAPKFIGALIGRLNNGLVENCHVKNSSVECNNWTIGGLVGQFNDGKISRCSVEETTIKGYAAVGAIVGIALGSGERTIEECSVHKCTIVQNGSFGYGDYDQMFGAVIGALYNGNLIVNVNDCTVSDTTICGESSSAICGYVSDGAILNVDGEYAIAATEEALKNAKAGDTILVTSDITLSEALTLPAGVIFNGNGKQINGTIYAGGDLTFVGHTKVTAFSATYYNRTITIGEGACLEVTGSDRVSFAYDNTFDITGTIENAKTADKANLQPSLIIPGGISITGGSNAIFNVTNAYVKIGNTSSKNSSANGEFTLNFTNAIAEFTNQFTFAEPTSGKAPKFTVNIKDSVLTTSTKMCIAAPNSTVNVDNSVVTLGSYLRNSGKLNLTNGSVLTGATIQFGENGGNDGDITVDNSSLTITASSTGHAFDGKDTGSITVTNGATVSVDYYKDMTISVDAASTFTGTEVQ